jgi:hypothetical protein
MHVTRIALTPGNVTITFAGPIFLHYFYNTNYNPEKLFLGRLYSISWAINSCPLKTLVLHYQVHKDRIIPVHTLTLSSLGISQIYQDLPRTLHPSGFPITIMSFISTYLTLLDFITRRIFGQKYIL